MSITLNANIRTEIGKGSSRRLRHADKVPAVIYGPGKEAIAIVMEHKDVIRVQAEEAFYTSDVTIVLEGKEVKARVQDMQRHAFKPLVEHVDFKFA